MCVYRASYWRANDARCVVWNSGGMKIEKKQLTLNATADQYQIWHKPMPSFLLHRFVLKMLQNHRRPELMTQSRFRSWPGRGKTEWERGSRNGGRMASLAGAWWTPLRASVFVWACWRVAFFLSVSVDRLRDRRRAVNVCIYSSAFCYVIIVARIASIFNNKFSSQYENLRFFNVGASRPSMMSELRQHQWGPATAYVAAPPETTYISCSSSISLVFLQLGKR